LVVVPAAGARAGILAALLAIGACSPADPPAASTASPPHEDAPRGQLSRGRPRAARITPGEEHHYVLETRAGQFLAVTVDQRELDLALEVRGPDGRVLTAVDHPLRGAFPERALWVAETPGPYRVVVRSAGPTAGGYQVDLAEDHPALPQDQLRAQAFARTVAGWRRDGESSAAAAALAEQDFAAAAALWHEAGAPVDEALALNHEGFFAARSGRFDHARGCYDRALALAREAGSVLWEAYSLRNLGELHGDLGESALALAAHRRALPLFRTAGDPVGEAATLSNLGTAFQGQGDYTAAEARFREAAVVARRHGLVGFEATAVFNLGALYDLREHRWQALELYRQALPLTEQGGDRRALAANLNNLGRTLQFLGDPVEALRYYQRALELVRELGVRQWEAISLHNLGGIAQSRGEYEAARDYYEQALAISREAGDRRGEASRLSSLGALHLDRGDRPAARARLEEALALRRELDDQWGLALTLRHLGRLYAQEGDSAAARGAYGEVLEIATARDLPGLQAAIYHDLAALAQAAGDLPAALAASAAAVTIAEGLRARLPGEDLRTAHATGAQAYFRRHIAILLAAHRREPAAGHDREAFAVSEAVHARTLLESLLEGGQGARDEAPAELVTVEREARQSLTAEAWRRFQGPVAETAGTAPEPVEPLTAVVSRHREAAARLAAARELSALRPGGGGPALETAQELLDDRTHLLEYTLAEPVSFLFVVRRRGFEVFELPSRDELETAARRLYELVTVRNRPAVSVQAAEQRSRITDQGFAREAAALAERLLPPAAVAGAHRLAIVADGALLRVPFAALPWGGAPLGDRYEILRLPSAAVLVAVRQRRGRQEAPRRTLAVLADPVFDATDPRLAGGTTDPPPADPGEVLRAARLAGVATPGGLPRLPFTRREAQALARLAPPGAVTVALDFDANRERALSPELAGHRILHFATHGLLNGDFPQLSGLVLSLVDRQGRPRDGFLRLADLYGPEVAIPAELVVLSACQTAAGREIPGEGLSSMARGFLHAGAGAVVGSLWPVDEVATARFMERFYRALLVTGQRPAEALAQAQRELAAGDRFSAPYYWAAFVLEGEWR
jgi:CHAT domain-containing protein/predicted negative regulator of RcsB-dependent stress response